MFLVRRTRRTHHSESLFTCSVRLMPLPLGLDWIAVHRSALSHCSLSISGKLYKQKAHVMVGERTEKLESIGFQWTPGTTKPSFEERLEECRDFRRENGHLDIPLAKPYLATDPTEYEDKKTRSFYQWAQRQRDEYRKYQQGAKSSLDKYRVRKLDEMHFVWELKTRGESVGRGGRPREYGQGKPRNENRFDERIAQLRAIKEQYGSSYDLKTLKTAGFAENTPLYQWIKAQRKQYKALKNGQCSSLTVERLAKLESVDFNFEPRKHYAAYGSKKASEKDENVDATQTDAHKATEEIEESDASDEEEQSAPLSYRI